MHRRPDDDLGEALAPAGLSSRGARARILGRAALHACCQRCPMVGDYTDGGGWPVEPGSEWLAIIPRRDGKLLHLFACALSSDYAQGYCRGLGREATGYEVCDYLQWLEGPEPTAAPADEQMTLEVPA